MGEPLNLILWWYLVFVPDILTVSGFPGITTARPKFPHYKPLSSSSRNKSASRFNPAASKAAKSHLFLLKAWKTLSNSPSFLSNILLLFRASFGGDLNFHPKPETGFFARGLTSSLFSPQQQLMTSAGALHDTFKRAKKTILLLHTYPLIAVLVLSWRARTVSFFSRLETQWIKDGGKSRAA